MTRFAAQRRVFYVEEPVWTAEPDRIEYSERPCGVTVVVPHLTDSAEDHVSPRVSRMLGEFFAKQQIVSYCAWYYTPMALAWTERLSPLAVVYDCMDELGSFKNAPSELRAREIELLDRADLVFTGGYSLFEAKRKQHRNVYPFPSSIDAQHFVQGRSQLPDPADQATIERPRLGFCGVVDERMDLKLLSAIAAARPDWHLVIIGPVVKIDPAELPRADNIHYLGMKSYAELPAYIGNWDAALLPFARNEATRFISPTKTPEYLAAGVPVVSTSIADVIRPYGTSGLVGIADEPADFIRAVERALIEDRCDRLRQVDALLSQTSWSKTWGRMAELLDDAVSAHKFKARPRATAAGVSTSI